MTSAIIFISIFIGSNSLVAFLAWRLAKRDVFFKLARQDIKTENEFKEYEEKLSKIPLDKKRNMFRDDVDGVPI